MKRGVVTFTIPAQPEFWICLKAPRGQRSEVEN